MAAKQNSGNNKLAMTILKGRTFIVLIILLIFFSITADNFMSAGALLTVAKHVALYGILAIGMTYVIITGGIDLSVGSVAGLAGMIAGGLIQEGLTLKMFGVTLYFSVPMIVLITVLLGALMGMLNGIVITKFNVAPFIATLGTMYILPSFGCSIPAIIFIRVDFPAPFSPISTFTLPLSKSKDTSSSAFVPG